MEDGDAAARLQLVLAIDHDLLAGLEAGIDQGLPPLIWATTMGRASTVLVGSIT